MKELSSMTFDTPIVPLNFKDNNNNFYIKREDLLPFSFGGNKVRIARNYFKDIDKNNFDCIISYGNSKSNMNRVIANMSIALDIPCYIVSPITNGEYTLTNNSKLIDMFNANIIKCDKKNVANTIEKLIDELMTKGYNPYYINGDKYGKGNESVAVSAYADTYDDILKNEQETGVNYDYIFHASGTGITQAGLIAGKIKNNDKKKKVIGISIARKHENGFMTIKNNILSYFQEDSIYNIDSEIIFEDDYLCGGYSRFNDDIDETIKEVLSAEGIYLDRTYTGKAFWGMKKYIKKNHIENSNILFLHTGSSPLFFDDINEY